GGDELPTYENVATRTESLHDHLIWQIRLSTMSQREQEIAAEIVGNLNDDGYLQATMEEISAKTSSTVAEAEAVLKRVQEFDPVGVAARDVVECLLVQAKLLGPDAEPVANLIRNCLPELEHKSYAQIAKKLSLTVERVRELAHHISEM
ncbi:MAG TPA: RNA polymerase sigma-54 factor, partial [bacterium]|nr:RNA polymerase sigma-54 factor [bacterium]